MVKHIHVDRCDSTQDILKEQLNTVSSGERVVVSCENQISGRGRGENKWSSLPGTLCFSMNLTPHPVMSFTALELSVIVSRFFETQGRKTWLKWPNDLWDEHDKKCAGILIQGTQGTLLAGIGINLFSEDKNFGGVFDSVQKFEKKRLACEIAEFIHENRYESTVELKKDWLSRCGHLNEMVRVTEGEEVTEGIFQGIGEHGEAVLCRDGRNLHLYNGSLRRSYF